MRMNSATTTLSSNRSGQSMANIIDPMNDSEMAPTHPFVSNPPAHYQQNPYPFPRGNGTFAADQDIQMAQELSHNMQQGVGDVAPTSAPRNNSHSQGHALDMTQTPVGPGMGPPHNRGSFSGNQVGAVEGTPDQSMMGDGKRKRSKVSRACDECRRKKIRCDATDDEGTIKTCSNCSRVNQSCSFSRVPMKRGPSKGYIKELSERVQQVESLQMQLAGQPAGYRQSIDSDYSPDEPFSGGSRRNYSFSDQRNPFASYPRDRIPSTGGWGVGSPTTPYQARDPRGSIALAPDQHLTDINGPSIDYTKPFWNQELQEGDGRAAKRQKLSAEDETANVAESVKPESLAVYFDTIHTVLPILPKNIADLTTILRNSSPSLTHAFSHVLSAVQSKPPPPGNKFEDIEAVGAWVWAEAKVQPSTRTNSENILWLWVYIFMAINGERDVRQFQGHHDGISQATAVKLASDLSSYLATEAQLSTEASEDSESILVRRAFYVVGILATLHALGSGSESPTPSPVTNVGSYDEMKAILPEEGALLGRACGVLAVVHAFVASLSSWKTNNSFNVRNKLLIEQHLSQVFGSAPQKPELDSLCRQIQSLVVIILARHTFILHPIMILEPALELANSFLETTTAAEATPKYNPLDIHLFSLTTITLLEFVESIDDNIVSMAQDGVAKIRRALDQIAERARSPDNTDTKSMHWSTALLRIIDTHVGPPAKTNGTAPTSAAAAPTSQDPNIDPGMAQRPAEGAGDGSPTVLLQAQTTTAVGAARLTGHDSQADKMMDIKTGAVQVVDTNALMRKGYLNVLVELGGGVAA